MSVDSGLGFVTAAAQYYAASILIKPRRSVGSFVADVTIEEQHDDELEITDHPVEQGALISDHAFKRPAELTLRLGWSDSPVIAGLVAGVAATGLQTVAGVQSLATGNSASQVKDTYAKLLAMQASRAPFTVYTGKRRYDDMLIKHIAVTTTRESEHSLMATIRLRQVIIVQTQLVTITAAAADQLTASATTPATDAGTKSVLPTTKYIDGY